MEQSIMPFFENGRMAEWSIATVPKTVKDVGSNPTMLTLWKIVIN